ncbi:MAG: fibronectin type III domain-containing protein [Candidatus Binatia bacterium]
MSGFADFSIPNAATEAVTEYNHNTIFGRTHKSSEDEGWTYGPNVQVPYNDGESILNTDIVLWYEGYLPHAAAEGESLWHSTGIRLVSNLATPPPPPGDTTPPDVPTNLSADPVSVSQINLTWTAPTDNVGVTGYELQRCQGSGCTNFLSVATPSGTTYSDTGLAASTTYRYQVRARDAAGNWSGYTTSVSATTQTPPPDTQPPTAPASLSANPASTSQINLSWPPSTDNVGVTGYSVERCQGGSCLNFVEVATPSGTTYSDTNLSASTTYRYRVRARDAAGNWSSYTTPVSATTPAPPPDTEPPTAPTSLTAVAVSSNQINLSWVPSTDNLGVTSYYVERCAGNGCSDFSLLVTLNGTITTYSNTGLSARTRYRYRVQAKDAAGNLSSYSNIGNARTQR